MFFCFICVSISWIGKHNAQKVLKNTTLGVWNLIRPYFEYQFNRRTHERFFELRLVNYFFHFIQIFVSKIRYIYRSYRKNKWQVLSADMLLLKPGIAMSPMPCAIPPGWGLTPLRGEGQLWDGSSLCLKLIVRGKYITTWVSKANIANSTCS